MVLGLDLSTKSSGWAVFDSGKYKDSGCVSISGSDVIVRIVKMADQLEKIIQKYPKIKYVYIEDPKPAHVGGNIDVYRKLTWLQGQVCIMLHKYNCSVQFTQSSHWRKENGIKTGRGVQRDSLKQKDIQKVKQLYNKTVNDDEADAILIARAYKEKSCGIIQF